ncbi:MAG: transposase [Ruminococcus sp.]
MADQQKESKKCCGCILLQIWFNLSDEGVEDAIYDSYAFRKFMNIDFMEEQVLDATTLLKIRYLLEENYLWKVFFKAINRVMEDTGHIMHGGLHERYFPERLKSEQIIWIAFRIFQNPMCIGVQFAGGAV